LSKEAPVFNNSLSTAGVVEHHMGMRMALADELWWRRNELWPTRRV